MLFDTGHLTPKRREWSGQNVGDEAIKVQASTDNLTVLEFGYWEDSGRFRVHLTHEEARDLANAINDTLDRADSARRQAEDAGKRVGWKPFTRRVVNAALAKYSQAK